MTDAPASRALVVGAGSIGMRHAAVLEAAGHRVAFVSSRPRAAAVVYPTVDDALAAFAPDYVVVATETGAHGSTVDALRDGGYASRLLIEKPMAVDPAGLAGFSRVGVGFNLRFDPVIVRFGEILRGLEIRTVEAYAGQELSGWRPGRPVGEQYSGSRARGGGVLRDLSHELDYLAWILGRCRGVFARGGRLGTVTADSDDAWGIVSEYERAPVVTLQLNYLDTRSRRRIVANTSAGTVEADVVAGVVIGPDGTETFARDRDASYRSMHAAMLGNEAVAVTTPAEAAATDELIGMIELSAAEQRWVSA